ncbi:MAG: NAD(P)-binding protein, partial [Burkholderiales bacterium]
MGAHRIAVIGAGPSGIAAAKECIAQGLGDGLVVFEKSDRVGGNWVYRDQPGHS